MLYYTYTFLFNKKYNYEKIKNTIKCFKISKCIEKCLNYKNTITIKGNYTNKDIPYPFPYNYHFIHYSICPFATILYVYIISECKQTEERDAIRLTWGKSSKYIAIRHIIGIGKVVCNINYHNENKKYGDIHQINIYESFSNETLFSLYTMKYLKKLCPYSQFYAKFDLDTYVNINKLYTEITLHKIKTLQFWGAEKNIWKKVNYDNSYKYSSPKAIARYYNSLFPKNGINVYSGFVTVFTSDIPLLLFNVSLQYPYLIRIDDQYISWILYILNISINPISSYAILPYRCNTFKNVTVIHRIMSMDIISYSIYINKTKPENYLL